MKKDLHLTATVDRPEVLENIIEELAARRYDIGYARARVPASWEAIDTSSVEAYLSGRVEFDYNETQRIRIPYITAFMFCCTKIMTDPYDLTWSLSLS
ncbi:MAG TPA: hypothetical protein VHL77_06100 [Ferruginibacter sp.]|nr:hypothetical protein [Ferruginibacter sp.]